MNTVSNVSAGKPKIGGAVFRAPVGTALPTSATASLAAAFKGLGFVSDAGVTNGAGVTTNSFKSWGGDVVLTALESRDDTFAMNLIESLNTEVLKTFYGDANVSGALSTGITVTANGKDLGSYSYVIDMIMRDGAIKRIVIPTAQISETGDVVYTDNDIVAYPVTLAAQPDGSGNTHYEYIQNTSAATVTLDDYDLTIAHGSTDTITATTSPAGGTVKWFSSDTDIATVTGGVVTAIAAGEAVITAKVVETGATATVVVTVT